MKLTKIILSSALFTATSFNVLGALIPLTEDVITTPDNGGNQRTPILVPVLYLDGYTLTAGNGTLGSTIQFLDEDGTVVYSTFVYIEGDIYLPTTLSGTYTIRVIHDSHTFEGTICL